MSVVDVGEKSRSKDVEQNLGEKIIQAREVLKYRGLKRKREPNVICRVESFGRMCGKFDEKRKRWVVEMGFGGLLHLCGLQLPRTLCYWLMTRVNPKTEMFVDMNGIQYRLSANQVKWVLGVPKGSREVPTKVIGEEYRKKADDVGKRFGKVWEVRDEGSSVDRRCRKGYPICPDMMERAEGEWMDSEEEEFKVLFLFLALQMVLCPTQSPRLPAQVIPAVTCAMDASDYDWCGLVLRKLLQSVRYFRNKFDKQGFATGCGGCSIFLAVFYIDRLARNPVRWGVMPRVKAWCNADMREACKEDRIAKGGDFGKLGMIDIAYGEVHPREARDVEACDIQIGDTKEMTNNGRGRRRGQFKCRRSG